MSSVYFNTLLKIQCFHEFYLTQECKDFSIYPTQSTQAVLNRYGLLYKNLQNGAVILYESADGSSNMKIPIGEQVKLTFQFELNNTRFLNFTHSEFNTTRNSIYYFNNLNPTISGNTHIILDGELNNPIPFYTRQFTANKHDPSSKKIVFTNIFNNTTQYKFNPDLSELKVDLSEFNCGKYNYAQFDENNNQIGSANNFYYNNELNVRRLFGILELFIDQSFPVSNPVQYAFYFKSRPVFYRYKIVKQSSNPPVPVDTINSATLNVKHEPDNPSDEIVFLPASGTDPIIIRSQNTTKLKENGIDKIRLKKNNEILISNLPNPTTDKLEKVGNDWMTDIYVYVYV